MHYTVIKHFGHLRTLDKCRKHEPKACPQMLMVLLDLSKAFDSLDQATLLVKLKSLGLSHSALEWFRSYLSERSQYVRIGSEVSGLENTDLCGKNPYRNMKVRTYNTCIECYKI